MHMKKKVVLAGVFLVFVFQFGALQPDVNPSTEGKLDLDSQACGRLAAGWRSLQRYKT